MRARKLVACVHRFGLQALLLLLMQQLQRLLLLSLRRTVRIEQLERLCARLLESESCARSGAFIPSSTQRLGLAARLSLEHFACRHKQCVTITHFVPRCRQRRLELESPLLLLLECLAQHGPLGGGRRDRRSACVAVDLELELLPLVSLLRRTQARAALRVLGTKALESTRTGLQAPKGGRNGGGRSQRPHATTSALEIVLVEVAERRLVVIKFVADACIVTIIGGAIAAAAGGDAAGAAAFGADTAPSRVLDAAFGERGLLVGAATALLPPLRHCRRGRGRGRGLA